MLRSSRPASFPAISVHPVFGRLRPRRMGWLLLAALAAFQRASANVGGGAPPTTLLSVFAVPDFVQALNDGVQHVVVKDHLDLRLRAGTALIELTTTDSIMGACSQENAPLVNPPRVGSQCVLQLAGPLLRAPSEGTLFMHQLYIIVETRQRPDMMNVIETGNSSLFITDSALVGDGVRSRGVDVVADSKVYAWAVDFFNFKAESASALRIANNSEVTLHNCTFSGNTVTDGAGFGPVVAVIDATGDVWFENCTFENNLAPVPGEVAVVSEVNWVCSNTDGPSVHDQELNRTLGPRRMSILEEDLGPVDCTQPQEIPTMACRDFPLPSDSGYLNLQTDAVNLSNGSVEAPQITPIPNLSQLTFEDPYLELGSVQTSPSSGSSMNRSTVVWIAAACVVAALLAVAVVGAAGVFLRRRGQLGNDATGEAQGLKATEANGYGHSPYMGGQPASYGNGGVPPGPPGPPPQPQHAMQPGAAPYGANMAAPPPGSTLVPPQYYLQTYGSSAIGSGMGSAMSSGMGAAQEPVHLPLVGPSGMQMQPQQMQHQMGGPQAPGGQMMPGAMHSYASTPPEPQYLGGPAGGGSSMSGGGEMASVGSGGLPPVPSGGVPRYTNDYRHIGSAHGRMFRAADVSDPMRQSSGCASTEAPPSELDGAHEAVITPAAAAAAAVAATHAHAGERGGRETEEEPPKPRVQFRTPSVSSASHSTLPNVQSAQFGGSSSALASVPAEENSVDTTAAEQDAQSRLQGGSGGLFGAIFGGRNTRGAPAKPSGGVQKKPLDMTAKFDRTYIPEQAADGATHEQVADMLDEVYGQQVPFDGRYWLLGPVNQRLGGAGVVQFAREAEERQGPGKRELGPDDVALKFFVQRAPFDRIIGLYTNAQVKPLMPAVLKLVHNNDRVATADQVLPPCMVMQRGESLEDWAARTRPNLPASLNALVTISQLIKDLHAAGYVYYAMKPTNVAWFREQRTWNLIDFGLTARQGNRTGLSFSLNYAAPEVIQALEASEKTMVVTPATDIWALGVVAWELLSLKRTFPPGTPAEEIKSRIAGRLALPWEEQDTKHLRTLKNSVLQCLSRDMAERPTAAEVHASWTNLLDFAAVKHTEVTSI